jgi:polyisoprenoid-binding protein YceI
MGADSTRDAPIRSNVSYLLSRQAQWRREPDLMGGRILSGLAAAVVFAATAGAQSKATAKSAPAHDGGTATRTRYVVAPTGNEARYRVREQLVGVDLPNDAIGTVKEITGSLLVDPNGNVVRDSSKIIVTLTSLKSDKTRRDGYVQRRTLETTKFPTVQLVPTSFQGLAAKPTTTPSAFDLLADLTVHGVTRPTTWKVTAHSDGADLVGQATTAFTFKDFSLNQPSVPVVLSVNDTIKLEYDFRFTPAGRQ